MMSPDLTRIIIALLAVSCVGGIIVTIFYARVAQRSESVRRLASIAASDPSTDRRAASDEAGRRRQIESTLRELEEKQKVRQGSKPSLTSRMRQAGLSWSKRTYVIACAAAGFISFLIAFAVLGAGPLPAVGFGISGGLLLPHVFVNVKRKRRFRDFATEFPNAVDVIVRGVKAGLPLVDCLRIISREAQEPVRSEFRVILDDQTMGLPIDQAVQRLPERVPLAEASFFAIVISLQSRTGGSLSETLGNLSKVLRERKKMQAKIKAMSSEAKASAGIIGSLPVIVAFLIYCTSPDYITLLFTTFVGKLVLAVCAAWMAMGVLVMRKMINFDF